PAQADAQGQPLSARKVLDRRRGLLELPPVGNRDLPRAAEVVAEREELDRYLRALAGDDRDRVRDLDRTDRSDDDGPRALAGDPVDPGLRQRAVDGDLQSVREPQDAAEERGAGGNGVDAAGSRVGMEQRFVR